MKKLPILFVDLGITIYCKSYDNASFAIACYLTRYKIDKYSILHRLNIPVLTCVCCGHNNPHMRYVVAVDTSVTPALAKIIGVEYVVGKTKIKRSIPYCFGSNKQCELYLKRLNPNSVEFVSIINGVSSASALQMIHDRNSTPFYQHNHKTYEDYKKSQSRGLEWWGDNIIGRDRWITEANYSRSLDGMMSTYGEQQGTEKYQRMVELKSPSIENFISRYGDTAVIRMQQYLKNTSVVDKLENYNFAYGVDVGIKEYIKKSSVCGGYDEVVDESTFIKYVIRFFRKSTKLVLCKGYPIELLINKSKTISAAAGIYYRDVEHLADMITSVDPELLSRDYIRFCRFWEQNGVFSRYSYTGDGQLLRSAFEAEFYYLLQEHNIPVLVGKNYPNSNLQYDFYIESKNLYIELCGLMNRASYVDRINEKKQLDFNIVFVYPTDDQEQVIKDIINGNYDEHR